ncbi:MAG: DinB family protein [Gemmatimonadales bacterium]
MRVSDLQHLYGYNYWANKKLFDVLKQLTPAQFTQSVAGSYGSIRNTLVHVLSAEWGWLDRCGGPPRGERLNPEDYPTVESLVQAWARVESDMREFLSGLKDDDLARKVEFSLGGGPKHSFSLGHLMQHAAVHAVHHRGQVALLLRVLGVAPGNFDLLFHAPPGDVPKG